MGWNAPCYSYVEFLWEFVSESIVKIGLHLPKLWSKVKLLFFETQCINERLLMIRETVVIRCLVLRPKPVKQGVALTGRNCTGPPCSVGPLDRLRAQRRPADHVPGGRPARRQRYKRRQTTTDTSEQNNTDPLGGPVIISVFELRHLWHRQPVNLHAFNNNSAWTNKFNSVLSCTFLAINCSQIFTYISATCMV